MTTRNRRPTPFPLNPLAIRVYVKDSEIRKEAPAAPFRTFLLKDCLEAASGPIQPVGLTQPWFLHEDLGPEGLHSTGLFTYRGGDKSLPWRLALPIVDRVQTYGFPELLGAVDTMVFAYANDLVSEPDIPDCPECSAADKRFHLQH
jgi:hypothetical protein